MAQVNFRMDDDLKRSAEDTFRDMGMTLSTAITIFVAQTVRDRQFPFVIRTTPATSSSTAFRTPARKTDFPPPKRRIGTMAGKWRIPTDDEDRTMDAEIEAECECLLEG